MIFYKIEADIKKMEEICSEEYEKEYELTLRLRSSQFSQRYLGNVFITVSHIKRSTMIMGAICNGDYNIEELVKSYLVFTEIQCKAHRIEEIELKEIIRLLKIAHRNEYAADEDEVLEDFDLDCFAERFTSELKFKERLVSKEKTEMDLLAKTFDFLCVSSLSDEVSRIYKGASIQVKKGHPVHYMIQTDDLSVRNVMLDTLMMALHSNDRIKNRRYSIIDLSSHKNILGESYEALFKANTGGTIIAGIERADSDDEEFASVDIEITNGFCMLAQKYQNDVLTIFSLPRSCEKIKAVLFEQLGAISVVQISEDVLFGDKAIDQLKQIAENQGIIHSETLISEMDDSNKGYLLSDLHIIFRKWYSQQLKETIYPQYSNIQSVKTYVAQRLPKGSAYSKLERMIGLNEAKATINQALDFYKAQKLFKDMGMVDDRVSSHMIFTGNPGTAKTTVARLFAQIMKENSILSSGNLVEVGRADLVGKYVGWTAKTVKSKFREARGSVLFIDEAYSLVDDRDGLFGDEAINTIVQEMENNNEQTVVIFAGYPDKMEKFMMKNPGLRSRISFHVHFNDYNAEELFQITELMAEEKKIQLDDSVKDKLLPIFQEAIGIQDFGNGRFARNVFEKARMKQAGRLLSLDTNTITKNQIVTLISDDFEKQKITAVDQNSKIIGFCSQVS